MNDITHPVRIVRSRKVKQISPNGLPIIYVGRPTKWGNPVKVTDEIDQEKAVIMYITSYLSQSYIEAAKRELRGKNLSCWCKEGTPCHANILIEIANS